MLSDHKTSTNKFFKKSEIIQSMGKKVQRKKKTQIAKIRNERGNITTDFTVRKRIMRV